ncbi:MAG: redox-regulated ATPase YchF [Sedimentisphaerales bacterium]|nr:redox-regulated ATPase YchF [Sedimentisphaerales bacterium]
MKTAIIGLLQSGKSTLLSAISGKDVPPAGITNIEEVIVPVPDERLDWLQKLYDSKKITHATIDCLDVPGFSFTDDHGRAAARRYFQQMRTVELLVLVIRAFEDPTVPAYRNSVNPKRDLDELRTELLLADLELVEKRIENLQKQVKRPTATKAKDQAELALQQKLQTAIESEKPISSVIETDDERELIKSLGFLTLKPVMIAVNVAEDKLSENFDFGQTISGQVPVVNICAKLEYELSQLDEQSRVEFMADMSLKECAVTKFVHSCYSALGLISFLTAASPEARAWPVKKGITAHEAAGKIHSDIKRGFIRAETMSYSDLKELGSEKAVKAAGKTRLEGKEYVIQDGDVILFRFNV